MTPAQVVDTIKWIDSRIPTLAKQLFLSAPAGTDLGPQSIAASHEMAYASAILERNSNAVQVLKAFGLESILNRQYITAWTTGLIAGPGKRDVEHNGKVARPWSTMMRSVGPWESLTVPKELREGSKDEILSIEIRHSVERVPLPIVAAAMEHLENAYSAVARIYLGPDRAEDKLQIISIQSGSLIRIDCRGIGEAVKHTKELLLESWRKIRHKRTDELVEKNNATLSSLAVIEAITDLEKRAALPPEEAETLRRTILISVTGLYSCNAVLAEIRPLEVVNNDKLLESFSPKLLGTGNSDTETDGKHTAKPTDGGGEGEKSVVAQEASARPAKPVRRIRSRRTKATPSSSHPAETDTSDPSFVDE